MRKILTERNIVVVLFVMVLITFSLAQEDSKKMERLSTGATSITAAALMNHITAPGNSIVTGTAQLAE